MPWNLEQMQHLFPGELVFWFTTYSACQSSLVGLYLTAGALAVAATAIAITKMLRRS